MNPSRSPSDENGSSPHEFDPWVSKNLRATPVPPELRASLRLSELTAGATRRPARKGLRPLFAVACAILVLLGGGYGVDEYNDRRDFSAERDFRSAMALYVASVQFTLDYKTDNLSAILQYLKSSQPISANEIPEGLRSRIPKGCKEIAWGRYSVSLICFYETKPGGRLVHLFIIDKRDMPAGEVASVASALRRSARETKGWETPTHVCVLVAGDSNMQIKHLVDTHAQVPVYHRHSGAFRELSLFAAMHARFGCKANTIY